MITDLIEHISFRGEKLTLVWKDEEPFVAMRPICDQIGLAWQPQHRKLTAPDNEAVVTMMVTTGADGKRYEMLCLHVMDVPFWLANLTPSRVKPELRDSLRAYKLECKLVLFQHVKARLLGDRDASSSLAHRMRADVMARKPLWTKIEHLMRGGFTFEAIWRASNKPQHLVVEALHDLLRLGLIDRLPDGMPVARPVKPLIFDQMSLFGEG